MLLVFHRKLLHLALLSFFASFFFIAPTSLVAMSPKKSSTPKGRGKQMVAESSMPAMLGTSCFHNEEALDKVRGLVG